jgi:hypothetical protein
MTLRVFLLRYLIFHVSNIYAERALAHCTNLVDEHPRYSL